MGLYEKQALCSRSPLATIAAVLVAASSLMYSDSFKKIILQGIHNMILLI